MICQPPYSYLNHILLQKANKSQTVTPASPSVIFNNALRNKKIVYILESFLTKDKDSKIIDRRFPLAYPAH